MRQQNFRNHTRLVLSYHIILWITVLATDVLAVIHLIAVIKSDRRLLTAVLFVLIALALSIIAVLVRTFPLVAQDRAIRTEESLRYFSLTGKLPDSRLTLSQLIALRFAPDEELLELTDRAVKENLSNSAIKQAIRHWKADYHRV